MPLEDALISLASSLDKLASAITLAQSGTGPETTPETPTPARRKKSTSAAAEPSEPSAPDTSSERAETSEPAKSNITPLKPSVSIEDARAALMDVVNTLGRDSGAEVLAKFGAKKIGDVAKGDYHDLIQIAQAMVDEVTTGAA